MTTIRSTARLLFAAALCLVAAQTRPAGATAILNVTITQVANKVAFAASGEIDLGGLTFHTSGSAGVGTQFPQLKHIAIGPSSSAINVYSGVSSTDINGMFGSGFTFSPISTQGGTYFGYVGNTNPTEITIGSSYVSNTTLNSFVTYNNATLASVGFNAGTYALTYSTGVINFTVSNAPEPATLALIGAPLLGMVALRRRRR